jgi:hypothetical protein
VGCWIAVIRHLFCWTTYSCVVRLRSKRHNLWCMEADSKEDAGCRAVSMMWSVGGCVYRVIRPSSEFSPVPARSEVAHQNTGPLTPLLSLTKGRGKYLYRSTRCTSSLMSSNRRIRLLRHVRAPNSSLVTTPLSATGSEPEGI